MSRNRELVIIADDDEDDLFLMTRALKEAGFAGQVRSFRDGLELLSHLKNGSMDNDAANPDLILLDLNMPKMDGYEVIKQLKKEPLLRTVPVVVHSCSNSERDISDCYKIGANSYVIKPQYYDQLAQNMRGIVDYWFKVAALPSEDGRLSR